MPDEDTINHTRPRYPAGTDNFPDLLESMPGWRLIFDQIRKDKFLKIGISGQGYRYSCPSTQLEGFLG